MAGVYRRDGPWSWHGDNDLSNLALGVVVVSWQKGSMEWGRFPPLRLVHLFLNWPHRKWRVEHPVPGSFPSDIVAQSSLHPGSSTPMSVFSRRLTGLILTLYNYSYGELLHWRCHRGKDDDARYKRPRSVPLNVFRSRTTGPDQRRGPRVGGCQYLGQHPSRLPGAAATSLRLPGRAAPHG